MEKQVLGLLDGWLDQKQETATGMNTVTGWTQAASSTASACLTDSCLQANTTISYPWYYYGYPYPVVQDARPIKLTMSEVERLREAAKDDKKLRKILNKFTRQIEVTVDFGEDR